MAYPRLLQPLQLRGHTLINRALMGSMHSGLEEGSGLSHSLEKMAAFFEERARGRVGLMVTGGIAPNNEGRLYPFAAAMLSPSDAARHRVVTEAVHQHKGPKIAMQILHGGRYSYHPLATAPSSKKAPIGWFTPREMKASAIERTIADYGRAAALAMEAGYDGVEVMGSEGYLINQFIAQRTNKRTDEWGGSAEGRFRLPIKIVEEVRRCTSDDFIIIFRLSMLDLVEGGSDWNEVVALAQAIEAAGASIINTGIGWHEARIPTIATCVPRGGFSWVTAKLRGAVSLPLVATNRINTPEIAESILSQDHADMVSMARPFLADPFFLTKAEAGTPEQINTCIACNQACLDHTFMLKRASCLVNPRAGYESELNYTPTTSPLKLAVVGAGPAGLAFATVAARRGHAVTLFEASHRIGGQFNLAKQVPGKEEFYETLRYFDAELKLSGVDVRLSTRVGASELADGGFDKVVLATGVVPRTLGIAGEDHAKVVSYIDVLTRAKPVGEKVAIVGAGGIGFDVAEFVGHRADEVRREGDDTTPAQWPELSSFLRDWRVDPTNSARGGLLADAEEAAPPPAKPPREILLLQRKSGKHGAGLGRTTGWIHRASLKKMGVTMLGGLTYEKVDDAGLHVKDKGGKPLTFAVDTVIVCAGQVSEASLEAPLKARGAQVYKIGGSHLASELDAKRAIDQASRLAAAIETAKSENVGDYVAPIGFNGWLYQKVAGK
ncbi:hypothetical protein AB1Y20_005080 [Prymnesium parvum]|uniref:Uncharacterized protein n=1 Tax=Prymnesium parvum TaxID=97485 RepID=A0AB34J359_PRYPA